MAFLKLLITFWPPKPQNDPRVSWDCLFSAYVHSHMNLQTCTKFGANRSNRLVDFQTFEFLTPKTPQNAPWCIEGLIVFSLCPFRDESADVYQIWCQSVQPCGRFSTDFCILWPPKTPQNAPWNIEGLIVFSLCPFPDESADVQQIWCQSVQPLGRFSWLLHFWPSKTPPSSPIGSRGANCF